MDWKVWTDRELKPCSWKKSCGFPCSLSQCLCVVGSLSESAHINNAEWRKLITFFKGRFPHALSEWAKPGLWESPETGQLWDSGLARLSSSVLLNIRRQIRYITHLYKDANREPRAHLCVLRRFYFFIIFLDTWGVIYRKNTLYPQIL